MEKASFLQAMFEDWQALTTKACKKRKEDMTPPFFLIKKHVIYMLLECLYVYKGTLLFELCKVMFTPQRKRETN